MKIKNYEEYKVDKHGRVYSTKTDTYLKPWKAGKGYPAVTLWNDTGKKKISVHRLVAQAFIPNPDNKPTVNHLDGDKSNNRVNNLEWATRSENMRHAYKNGLNYYAGVKGDKHPNSKVDSNQVEQIRHLHQTGFSYRDIALVFPLTYGHIAKIIRKENWA